MCVLMQLIGLSIDNFGNKTPLTEGSAIIVPAKLLCFNMQYIKIIALELSSLRTKSDVTLNFDSFDTIDFLTGSNHFSH